MGSSDDEILYRTRRAGFKRESRKLGFLLYESFYEPVVFVKAVYRQLITLFLMFVCGSVIFAFYEHLPPIDALLASVSTITTIGLYVPNGGNFVTLNRTEAAFLIVMIIVSVGAGASIVQSTVGAVVNGALAKGEAEKRLIDRLKKHVIVFGYGHLGKYVIEKLEELGFDYVVVTKDEHVYDELLKSDVLTVLERETRPMEALRMSGIEKAEMVVVSHVNDPDNMMTILSARKLRPDIRIVSVVHDSGLLDTARNAGADVVIPSAVTVGHLLALSAVTKNLVGIVFSQKVGTKEIAEFSVFKSSSLIGKGMAEVSQFAVVIGVVRGDSVQQNVFDPTFRLKEGDTILVLGDPSKLQLLEREARAT